MVERGERGWQQHGNAQTEAWLMLTPLQRLRWLDEAKRFAQKYAGAAGEAKSTTQSSGQTPGA